jgi:hypothetical protein
VWVARLDRRCLGAVMIAGPKPRVEHSNSVIQRCGFPTKMRESLCIVATSSYEIGLRKLDRNGSFPAQTGDISGKYPGQLRLGYAENIVSTELALRTQYPRLLPGPGAPLWYSRVFTAGSTTKNLPDPRKVGLRSASGKRQASGCYTMGNTGCNTG